MCTAYVTDCWNMHLAPLYNPKSVQSRLRLDGTLQSDQSNASPNEPKQLISSNQIVSIPIITLARQYGPIDLFPQRRTPSVPGDDRCR
jgi:hypothetical protein